jgi:hypothetical protein
MVPWICDDRKLLWEKLMAQETRLHQENIVQLSDLTSIFSTDYDIFFNFVLWD